jgi:hypothetical protein
VRVGAQKPRLGVGQIALRERVSLGLVECDALLSAFGQELSQQIDRFDTFSTASRQTITAHGIGDLEIGDRNRLHQEILVGSVERRAAK